jgi:5-methylcytosine-specific restriction endonuclease McrA
MLDSSVLSHQSLVLNRSWSAIATTSVRRALGLLFTGAAKVVQPDTYEVHEFHTWTDLAVHPGEPCIRTVRLKIKVPEVIVLTKYGGMPNPTVTFSRRNLYKRDRSTCQYCGKRPGSKELSIDHVVPRSRGGRTTWENCVLACMRCNRRKASRLPTEAGLKLLKRPTRPKWTPILEAPIGRIRQSWDKFVSDCYWDVPLEE